MTTENSTKANHGKFWKSESPKPPASVRTPQIVHYKYDATPGCPVCQRETEIEVERETSVCQAISSAMLCLFCFPLIFPCAIPFCINSCYDKKLICKECGASINRERCIEIDD
uniref:LITAF domain-containing protein n=1 Tax=Panagrolaimus davidi TaxID=227884 RepID=A0A914PEJ2_9BILA